MGTQGTFEKGSVLDVRDGPQRRQALGTSPVPGSERTLARGAPGREVGDVQGLSRSARAGQEPEEIRIEWGRGAKCARAVKHRIPLFPY
jgi:hypothetical protein